MDTVEFSIVAHSGSFTPEAWQRVANTLSSSVLGLDESKTVVCITVSVGDDSQVTCISAPGFEAGYCTSTCRNRNKYTRDMGNSIGASIHTINTDCSPDRVVFHKHTDVSVKGKIADTGRRVAIINIMGSPGHQAERAVKEVFELSTETALTASLKSSLTKRGATEDSELTPPPKLYRSKSVRFPEADETKEAPARLTRSLSVVPETMVGDVCVLGALPISSAGDASAFWANSEKVAMLGSFLSLGPGLCTDIGDFSGIVDDEFKNRFRKVVDALPEPNKSQVWNSLVGRSVGME